MSKAIKVENLSKAYQLGDFGTGTISRDLERFWARMRGKEDPFLKIGEVNDRATKGESDVVWSLNNINFEVEQGDAVGIIGRNGAGKSTLLKILSRVTSPTTGSVKLKGRIASLLEVGTGFHPELTGRENIYLNGTILGMRKAEIKRKFDEIVDFSGVERYIDTPVKRYSSGMYVRLAFAVAAHLESEILIVDEVLAVGDAEFQKKCLGKMSDVSKGEGRTVLFVSHNMDAVTRLCTHAILLKKGFLTDFGLTNKIVDSYLRSDFGTTAYRSWENGSPPGNDIVKLLMVQAMDSAGLVKEVFDVTEPVFITLKYQIIQAGHRLTPALNFLNANGVNLFDSHMTTNAIYNQRLDPGYYESRVCVPGNTFSEGTIIIGAGMVTHNPFSIHFQEADIIAFNMVDKTDNNPTRGEYRGGLPGLLRPFLQWTSDKTS
ncbi:MAG: polysaccharide ABC transporter ATP-binding protein [Mucilaginibacter sp.]|uniref:ABC transporter ATP-binding protein n=1 Tax=Mucilaginibacter sp. TaxID=1882438 RepID=UPI0031A19D12